MSKRLALFLMALVCRVFAFADEAAGVHIVKGDCLVRREGVLIVYAVDEDGFGSPQTGFRELRLHVALAESENGMVNFSFALPSGRYGIRCFLDLNGNGRLDRGPFGPTEPWGMSWNAERRFGFPNFEDISFMVDKDIQGLRIEVR